VTIARLHGEALLAARIGDDLAAGLIAAELEGYGADCRWLRRFEDCGSSVSAVMVDPKGERMIVNHLDAALPRDASWLPEPRSVGARCVLVDVRWPEGALAALAHARHAGLPGVLDADRPVPVDGALLNAASHVAFSADALSDYTGDDDLPRALARVAAELGNWCCVTAGAQGVWVAARGLVENIPAFAVTPVDTLGAGDVWHGAFALALAEGRSEPEAVRFASAAAAIKVTRFGGRKGVPDRAEVDTLLAARAAQA
jgi:sulfofructose kinase